MSVESKSEPDRPSLLIVDDEKELLQIVAEFLSEEGFDLTLANTGTEALAQLHRKAFDLIVTDLNMPGADGLTVLREAKAMDPQPEVIVLTGNASTLSAIEALRQGAYDYVLKPFDLFEMDQTIRKALERRRLMAENRRFVESLQEANLELVRREEDLRRHRDELSRMVSDATLRIRTLYDVGKEITSSLHLGRTLALITERSIELTGAQQGALFLLDESGQRLECRVCPGVVDASDLWNQLLRSLSSANARVLEGRRPVRERISDGSAPSQCALLVPLLQEGNVIGTVAVLNAERAEFTPDDEELLVSLAAQASIAIHNARLYGEIRELERLKSEFVAVVSHEVRTPLTSIKGTLELLADDRYFQADAPQKELLTICQANAERLEVLINDILDFSKLESSRLSSHFTDISISSLLDGVVTSISNQAERKGIQLSVDLSPNLPPLTADELRIIQVMNNLLSNAIKFSPSGSTIRIQAREDEDGITFRIQDQGIGIPPEDLPKLFTRFRQLDSSSTRKAGGTGLGLVISKGIVEEHGGKIWAESTPGEGSTFSFWLPNRVSGPFLPGASLDTEDVPLPH